MLYRVKHILPIVLLSGVIYAQKPDTLQLNEFSITKTKQTTLTGPAFKNTLLDSASLNHYSYSGLDELLPSQSPVFIKSYGKGNLASVSFRGTGSVHTQINWNGISLNSPTLGMNDISLIPVTFSDEVSIAHGGASLAFGTGGMGGSIQLNNKPDWNNKLNVSAGQYYGSFHDSRSNVSAKYGNHKVQGKTAVVYNTAENNFPYINPTKEDRPVEYLQHAGTKQYQLMQDIYAKITPNSTLSGKLWKTNSYRNLPPTLTSPVSKATLKYDVLRMMLDLESHFRNGDKLIVRSAFLSDLNEYQDSLTDISSVHQTYTSRNQVRYYHFMGKKAKLHTGADLDLEMAQSDGYRDNQPVYRTLATVFADFRWRLFKRTDIQAHFREETVDEKFSPVLFSAGIRQRIFKKHPILLKANFSRNYRTPSLHDLYWYPGGNPELKPEQGNTAEAGIALPALKFSKVRLKVEVTAFYSRVTNWILWSPTEGGYWQPQNLKEVLSRGIESSLLASAKIMGFSLEGKGSYSYTKSTNEKPTSENDLSMGKQLIYVPEHQYNATARISRNKYYLSYEQVFTGVRYITTDNSWHMPFYNVTHLTAGKNFSLMKAVSLNVMLRINNVFDKQFQSIANRPMPGRYYGLSVQINFNKR